MAFDLLVPDNAERCGIRRRHRAGHARTTIPAGGTPLAAIKATGRSRATLEFGRTLFAQETAGQYLEQNFGVPRQPLGMPLGLRESDRFFEVLQELAGCATPGRHALERGRLIDAYVDGHKYIFNKRAVVYGEEDLVVGLAAFLAEIVLTREWMAAHQGIYVKITPGVEPNPFLEELPGVKAVIRDNDGDIILINLSPKIYKVFDLLGFSELFEIVDNEAAAEWYRKVLPVARRAIGTNKSFGFSYLTEAEALARLERCKEAGYWIAGASEHAKQTAWEASLEGRIVLVMGSEGEGLARQFGEWNPPRAGERVRNRPGCRSPRGLPERPSPRVEPCIPRVSSSNL